MTPNDSSPNTGTSPAGSSSAAGSPGRPPAWPPAAPRPIRPPELARGRWRSWSRTSPRRTSSATCRAASPLPHSLPEEKKREVGLTRETWKLEVISDPEQPGDARQAAHEEGRHRPRLRRPAEARREARGPVRQGDDLPEHRLPARHGHLGGRAAPRGGLADAAEGEPAPRLLLRLPQRRPEADVPQLAAGRPRAGRPRRPAAGDPLLQAQRRVARPPSAAGRCGSSCRRRTASSRSSG